MSEKELVIAKADIATRVAELGDAITRDYKNRQLLVIGILNGAFIFMADLVREIKLAMEVDFIRAASYGMDTEAGALRFTKDIELDGRNKDILLIEDIVDTGRTLKYLKQSFMNRGARSVRICALIDKKERREVEIAVDYVGFTVPRGFLVGYGLDCRERFRELPEVYHLKDV